MNIKSKKAKTLLSMCDLQGIGLEIGGSISPLLPKSKGFIVSDERPKPDSFMSHPVYHLSELSFMQNKTGVLLAMTAASTESVIPLLEARGATDYIEI